MSLGSTFFMLTLLFIIYILAVSELDHVKLLKTNLVKERRP
ncbi:hypothetical protein HMPREF0541_00761 [Lacticaseibacillus rhamnosus ATCC 21052]|nr:hypothetical protein HMPREF0541_00761 [Lacticaseibacillus rhamnosus ATCC 21052]